MVLSCFTKQCKVPLHFSERKILVLYVRLNFVDAANIRDCVKKDCSLKETRCFDVIILSNSPFRDKRDNRRIITDCRNVTGAETLRILSSADEFLQKDGV